MSMLTVAMPPALFDVENEIPPAPERVYREPFQGLDRRRCADCRGSLTSLPWTHGCGGAQREGMFELCDDCAALELVPGTSRSRWGVVQDPDQLPALRRKQLARRARNDRSADA